MNAEPLEGLPHILAIADTEKGSPQKRCEDKPTTPPNSTPDVNVLLAKAGGLSEATSPWTLLVRNPFCWGRSALRTPHVP